MVKCTSAKPECMSRVAFGDCACLRVREETAREIETRFCSVVDADGLSGLPSDMLAALDALARASRNRSMWKGQCERQSDEITRLRAQAEAMRAAIVAFLPRNIAIDNETWADGTLIPLDTTLGELRTLKAAIAPENPDAD